MPSGATAASAFPPADFHAGDTPADHPGASRPRSAAPTALHAGDTPSDHPGARRARGAAPIAFRAGDTPADHPGASRARTAARTRSRSRVPSALSCATSPRRSRAQRSDPSRWACLAARDATVSDCSVRWRQSSDPSLLLSMRSAGAAARVPRVVIGPSRVPSVVQREDRPPGHEPESQPHARHAQPDGDLAVL